MSPFSEPAAHGPLFFLFLSFLSAHRSQPLKAKCYCIQSANTARKGEKTKLLFLIDPLLLAASPVLQFGSSEPESDLLVGVLDGVRTVDDVTKGRRRLG